MPVEQRSPAVNNLPTILIVGDGMIKTSIILQDLRRKIYLKEKDEKTASAGTGEGEVGFTNPLGLYNDYRVKYYRVV
jgi:hypothetical protein